MAAQGELYSNKEGPSVKVDVLVQNPENPEVELREPLSLNNHLHPKSESKRPTKEVLLMLLEKQTVSSVVFNEIESLVLTKSNFRVISYINFKPHLATFAEIRALLLRTLNKTNSFMQLKSFPPYYRSLTGSMKMIQNSKNQAISLQLQDLYYEINLVMKNFDMIKEHFFQITWHTLPSLKPTHPIPVPNSEESIHDRSKRSIVSSIFKFIFGGEDNSESINILKQNVAMLMANDDLQEKCLNEILKAQQLNAGEIKINRDLLRQMTKDLAQINVTLEKITFHTNILFTLAKFQVSISQLRHRVNVIRDAIFGLQMNLDILYHHFSAMVNNKLSPEMISPRNLLKILSNIQDDI